MVNSVTHQKLTASQAYCSDLMGITRWVPVHNNSEQQLLYRPAMPWLNNNETHALAIESLASVEALDHGFTSMTSANNVSVANQPMAQKVDPEDKNKSVASLREELGAGPEVIVEDLQPIEELAVAIETPKETIENFPKQLQCLSFLVESRLLILSDIPTEFQDHEAVEKLALKMSQALLKKSITEWQSRSFNWPSGLQNPTFLNRTDWMLGAFESFIESQLSSVNESRLLLVLAGQQIHKLAPELMQNTFLQQAQSVQIVSLPELYRIPEYKAEAWDVLQTLLD